jgi:hypothetical protein
MPSSEADASHTANSMETPGIDQQSAVYALLSPESSPEQKFVGLYLIPKVLSLEDEPGLRELKKHLPWSFLGQLLKQGSDHPCLANGFRLKN